MRSLECDCVSAHFFHPIFALGELKWCTVSLTAAWSASQSCPPDGVGSGMEVAANVWQRGAECGVVKASDAGQRTHETQKLSADEPYDWCRASWRV